jgi:hypothetical protein
VFNTPLPAVMDMSFTDVVGWWQEAQRLLESKRAV